MTRVALQQRCWNHEGREAVCLCPACGRSYCRECVTEHEARLLCASCLQAIARKAAASGGARTLAPAALAIAGVLLTWMIFFAAGETLMTFNARVERTEWQNR